MQSNRRKKMIIAGASLLLAVAVVAVGVWLVVSGRVVVVAKQPDQRVEIASPLVCGDDIVKRYNTANVYEVRAEGAGATQDTQALDEITSSIDASKGSERDPTCQTLLFWASLRKADYGTAREALDRIKQLHTEQKYANSNMSTFVPVSQLDSLLQNAQNAADRLNKGEPNA